MNVVFLSPHFPPHWFRFAVALRDAGATTLGIADVDADRLNPELRAALHDYGRVDDLGNYDQLTRALGWFIHRHGRIDRIDSLEVLARKGVPATFDYWGTDVEHHWYWWQKMLRHHLGVLWSG